MAKHMAMPAKLPLQAYRLIVRENAKLPNLWPAVELPANHVLMDKHVLTTPAIPATQLKVVRIVQGYARANDLLKNGEMYAMTD